MIMSALEGGRINVAARSVGLARAAFEDSIRYAQQRETFGKPIAQHQLIAAKLAEMATRIEASKLLTYQAATMKAAGKRCVLVITGKGAGREGGVMRQNLPHWLNLPANRARLVAFAPAQPKYGGHGAYYLLLKRRRR